MAADTQTMNAQMAATERESLLALPDTNRELIRYYIGKGNARGAC